MTWNAKLCGFPLSILECVKGQHIATSPIVVEITSALLIILIGLAQSYWIAVSQQQFVCRINVPRKGSEWCLKSKHNLTWHNAWFADSSTQFWVLDRFVSSEDNEELPLPTNTPHTNVSYRTGTLPLAMHREPSIHVSGILSAFALHTLHMLGLHNWNFFAIFLF